jgi:hypothetical protein
VLLQPRGDFLGAQPLVREGLNGPDQADLRRQPDGDQEGLDALLQLGLAGGEDLADVARAPGVRECPGRSLGQWDRQLLDLARADRLPACPGRELFHLLLEQGDVVARDLDEATGGVVSRLRPHASELAPDPDRGILRLRHVIREHLPTAPGDELSEHAVLARLVDDERDDGSSDRIGEVDIERLHVGLLPLFDTLDHDQPPSGEEAQRVQRGGHVFARHQLGAQDLDRFVAEPRAQAAEGAADLRAIGTGEEVDRAQLVRHRE